MKSYSSLLLVSLILPLSRGTEIGNAETNKDSNEDPSFIIKRKRIPESTHHQRSSVLPHKDITVSLLKLCMSSDECLGDCARSEALLSAELVCCESGDSMWAMLEDGNYHDVCLELAVGDSCHNENALCASGICGMNQTCLGDTVPSGSPCSDNAQCSGDCARSEALLSAELVCCESGDSMWAMLEDGNYHDVCLELAAGASCRKENRLCASGICGMNQTCLSDTFPSGSPCSDNAQCPGQCALSEALETADKVCCISGSDSYDVYISSVGYRRVCDELPDGAACNNENALCASRICGMNQTCLSDTVSSGSPCSDDAQCPGQCALSEALEIADKVCCISGSDSYVYISGVGYRRVCDELPAGAACGDENTLCASGICGSQKFCLNMTAQPASASPTVYPTALPSTAPPTSLPTGFPSVSPSISPSPTTCNDNNLCTVDSFDPVQNMCSHSDVVFCPTGESCNPLTGSCVEDAMLMPCVAVIDEDSEDYGDNTESWLEFRAEYPDRPFCLLMPFNPSYDPKVTIPPEVSNDPNFQVHNVTRDEGSGAADNWFNLCGLGKLTSSNVRFLGLFVDESGSMKKGTVLNSYNKFIADVTAANLKICEVFNGEEDWTTPFMTKLSPNGGICQEVTPNAWS